MTEVAAAVLNHFLGQLLVDDDRIAYRGAEELATAGVFDHLAQLLEPWGQVHVQTDPAVNPSCVIGVDDGARPLLVYLSTVLPCATVVAMSTDGGFDGFLSRYADHDWAVDLRRLLESWGFLVLDDALCRAPSKVFADDTGHLYSLFEALFERELEPPWKWERPSTAVPLGAPRAARSTVLATPPIMPLSIAAEVISTFLLQVLREPHQPWYRRPGEAAMHDAFGCLADDLASYGEVRNSTEYNINPSCHFRIYSDSPTVWVWVSAVLPYATVVVSDEEGCFAGFLSDVEDQAWASSLRVLLRNKGFLVLDGAVCRAMSPIYDYADEHQQFSCFEALFEYDVDPPWEWMGVGPGA